MTENEKLLTTEVGSTMWGMRHPGSDTDLFTIYKVPTMDILRGLFNPAAGRGHSNQDKVAQVDSSSFEIQHVIDELIKGNVNFIWGVLSQVVVEQDPFSMRWLRQAVLGTAAKNIANSARGLAASCVRDVETGKTTETRQVAKKYKQAIRTLRFASSWLIGMGPSFQPVAEEEATLSEYITTLWVFEYCLQYSRLPDRVDPAPFHDLLLLLRLRDLGPEDLL